jgi:predicted metal-dependent enzyme (double-stranded beta helix superfamily)
MPIRAGTCLTEAIATALRVGCARGGDRRAHIICGRAAISRAVVEGCDLDAMWRESDPDKRLPGGYRRHQVVRDPEYGFTVVVLLWEPGASTPIHDHDTWCVFGVLEGSLEITDYEVVTDDGEGPFRLKEVDRQLCDAGITGDNLAADTEVHRVRNTGSERAISLHVYGADLTQRRLFFGRGIRVDGKSECFGFRDQPAY